MPRVSESGQYLIPSFLIYLHFYYHQPSDKKESKIERNQQWKQNKMNISFFVGFYGDTRGINIYLCNNFLLFSVSLSAFFRPIQTVFIANRGAKDSGRLKSFSFCSTLLRYSLFPWINSIYLTNKSSTCRDKTIYHIFCERKISEMKNKKKKRKSEFALSGGFNLTSNKDLLTFSNFLLFALSFTC